METARCNNVIDPLIENAAKSTAAKNEALDSAFASGPADHN